MMVNAEQCIVEGSAVAFVVRLLRRVPGVTRHPKIAAAAVSTALAAFRVLGSAPSADAKTIAATVVTCAAVQLAGAIATNEMVIRPVAGTLGAAAFRDVNGI